MTPQADEIPRASGSALGRSAGVVNGRMLEYRKGTSSKFWEVQVDGARVATRFGRIGSAGQKKTRRAGSPAEAQRLADQLMREKLSKGYVEAVTAERSAPPKSRSGKSPGAEALPAWMGRSLGVNIADDDADDAYVFELAPAPDGALEVRYTGSCDPGGFRVAASALDASSASAWISISQGVASLKWTKELSPDVTVDSHVPPFLLPRGAFKALKEGQPQAWTLPWGLGGPTTLALAASGTIEIDRDGRPHTLGVCQITGRQLELWVVDDERWPVIVRLTQTGGCHLKLLAAGDAVSVEQVEALARSAPEPVGAAQAKTASSTDALALLSKAGAPVEQVIAAVEACGALSDVESRDALLRAAGHAQPDVRAAATKQLKRRADEEGMGQSLMEALMRVTDAMLKEKAEVAALQGWHDALLRAWGAQHLAYPLELKKAVRALAKKAAHPQARAYAKALSAMATMQ
jgi:predicted DNA-binding WGR domain protein